MRLQQGFTTGGMGSNRLLRRNNPQDRMSALGQKRTSAHLRIMSALPPKADMDQHGSDVPIGRDVGQADDCFISLHRPLDRFLDRAVWQRRRCLHDACGRYWER